MQTFDQHLADLVQSGEVTFDIAMAATTNPSDFDLKMRMFRRVTGSVTKKQVDAAEAAMAPAAPAAPAPAGLDGMTPGGTFDFL
jgi:twitching motility protein PilT